jgi:uncharacterized protein YerC
MADRIEILRYLKSGLTQRDIAEKMWVSITTVSRWSKLLSYERKAIHKYI